MSDEREELYKDYVSTSQDWLDTLNEYAKDFEAETATWPVCLNCDSRVPPDAVVCDNCDGTDFAKVIRRADDETT